MANFLYDLGRNLFLSASGTAGGVQIDWLTDVIVGSLIHTGAVGTDYPQVQATVQAQQYFSQVEAFTTAIVWGTYAQANTAPSPAFLGKTAVAGVAKANDQVFPAVTTAINAGPINAVIIWKKLVGTSATSPLIAYIDQSATGAFSITPNSSSITLQFDTGVNKIFKL